MLKGSVQLGIMFSSFLFLLYIFFLPWNLLPWAIERWVKEKDDDDENFKFLVHISSSFTFYVFASPSCLLFFLLTLLFHSALCVPLVHYENFIWKGPALVLGRKMGDCEENTRAQKKNETTKSRKGRSKWRTLNFWWFELNYWGGFFIDAGTNVIWSRRARSLTLSWGMGDEGEH